MPEFSVSATSPVTPDTEMAGRWWLAAHPDRSVGGVLRYGGGEGALELTDGLVDERQDRDLLTVLGVSTTGERVTVPCAWLSSSRRSELDDLPHSHVTQKLRFVHLLRGAHFEDGDGQVFDSFSFATESLARWVDKWLAHDDHAIEGTRTISIDLPQPISIPLPDGRLTFEWLESGTWGVTGTSVRLVPAFVWYPEAGTSLDDALQSVAQPLEFFLTLAVGNVMVFDEITARTGDSAERSFRTASFHGRLPRKPGPGDAAARHWEQLLPFRSIEGRLPEVLPLWFELARAHRSAMVQYFAAEQSPHVFLEELFLSTVRALEIWHRDTIGGTVMSTDDFTKLLAKVREAVQSAEWEFLRSRLQHANEPSLKQRLDALIADAGEPITGIINRYHKFVRRVVDTRNVLTHLGSQGDRPFDHGELFYAQKTCAALFAIVVLQAAGLGDLAAERVPATSNWRWIGGKSNPLIAPQT